MSASVEALNKAARPKLKKQSQVLETLKRLCKNRAAMIGLIILLVEIFIAIFGRWLMPYEYNTMDFTNACAAPSFAHPMGTDDFGRDILSRILFGTRYSLGLGFLGIVTSMIIGVIIGSIVGYFGGLTDSIIMRVVDIFQSIPGILLSIAISSSLGSGFINTVLALSFSHIPSNVRLLRGSILNIRKMEYLEAADAINCSKFRTIVSHILPNSFAPMIVQGTMSIASIIMSAASLSYIGLGILPPTPEWGAMLAGSRNFIRDYPFMVIFPGLAIAITVLSLNMLGDGLRDALDPKLKD